MDTITREIFLKTNTYKELIEISQGTNGIPLIFMLEDYDIPDGTKAIVFVQKPSGKAIQETAQISSNNITITVTSQMTAEVGESLIQVQLLYNDKNIFTFNHPMMVSKSAVPINSENGSSFIDEYIDKMKQATSKTETATDRANEVSDRIEQKAQNGDFSSTVKVGNTVTGEPGTKATVKNSGTTKDAILDFTIPKGVPGVATSLSPGIFGMYIREDGHLIVRHNDNDPAPPLSVVDGHLIYTIS